MRIFHFQIFQARQFKMSSGFVSENELAERRRIRQEEWEKVREPNQPAGEFSEKVPRGNSLKNNSKDKNEIKMKL